MSQIEVILCKRIANLGTVGDKVFVKAGFARNYLIPQELAVRVNDENIKEFEAKRAQLESQERDLLKEAEQRAEKVKDLRLCKEVKTSVDGKLYGSVAPRDVVSLISEAGIEINKQQVHLVAGNIHQVGTYEVLLQFHSDVMVKIMLDITSSNPEYDPSAKEKPAEESVQNEETDVVGEVAKEETAEVTEEVVAEATEVVEEVTKEAVAEVTEEAVVEVTEEAVAEVTEEAVAEVTEEAVAEVTEEGAAEATAKDKKVSTKQAEDEIE